MVYARHDRRRIKCWPDLRQPLPSNQDFGASRPRIFDLCFHHPHLPFIDQRADVAVGINPVPTRSAFVFATTAATNSA